MKTNFKSALAVVLAVFLSSPALFAQKIDLSGDYILNKSMSTLSADFTLAPQTLKIVQQKDSFAVEKVTDMMGQIMNTAEKFTIDGAECVNAGFMGMDKKSKALWNEDGVSLWVSSTMDMQGDLVSMTEVYYLDNEGRLKIDLSASSSAGSISETYVMDKQ
jgi:hypothetical protein